MEREETPEFSWNYYLKEYLKYNLIESAKWSVILIQGYVGAIQGEILGKEVEVCLLSRRSHRRGGTRYNARGVDDDGNVANFVETE